MKLNDFSSDILIKIFSYLPIKDSLATSRTCHRFFYLIEHFQKNILSSELKASCGVWLESNSSVIRRKGDENYEAKQKAQSALDQLRQIPNISFCFSNKSHDVSSSYNSQMQVMNALLPPMTPILCVNSYWGILSPQQHSFECFVGHFQLCSITPFLIESHSDSIQFHANLSSESESHQLGQEQQRVFFVYANGTGMHCVTSFVEKLQAKFPSSLIVGGICTGGAIKCQRFTKTPSIHALTNDKLTPLTFRKLITLIKKEYPMYAMQLTSGVSSRQELIQNIHDLQARTPLLKQRPTMELHTVENGIFGIALTSTSSSNTLPIQSVVSRGVKSLSKGCLKDTFSSSPSNYIIQDVEILQPSDPNYPYEGIDLHPVAVIHSVQNIVTKSTMSPLSFLSQHSLHNIEFIGFLSQNNQDSTQQQLHPQYQLQEMHNNLIIGQNLAFFVKDSNKNLFKPNTMIDVFMLDPEACVYDLQTILKQSHDHLQQKIMGAIMISCNGRSPNARFFKDKTTNDATIFHEIFQNNTVPCLGFYAGGEIGPKAVAGNRLFQRGNVALQGFTAVFAFFVFDKETQQLFSLDDDPIIVKDYIKNRLGTMQLNN